MMDFDEILVEIGEFGRYQKTNYFLICLPVMFAAANSLSYVFTAGTPEYRCAIPACDDPVAPNLSESWLVNAVPGNTDKTGRFTPQSCLRYSINESYTDGSTSEYCSKHMFLRNVTERCSEFVYSEERTIMQDWKLTCKENAWKLAFVGTMHFAGLVVGTAVSGYFADRYGRKNIFVVNIMFMAITGIAQGLAWDYISFLVFAFLNAVGTSGVYPLAFIIGVEMVGPRMREMSSMVLNYFYAVGEAMVGLIAWVLHDWQLLQYALSVPPLFFIVYYWLVPESVRWLLARNEKEKACLIIQKAANVNKKQLSMAFLASIKLKDVKNDAVTDGVVTENQNITTESDQIWVSVKQVFRSKRLLVRYSLIMYIWVINAVVFYGLSLNSTSLVGNKYLNFVLVCLVEIPGYSLAWISLRKLGRRIALCGSLFLCFATCAAGGYATAGPNWIIITLFLIGKLGITSSFAVIYAYTTELMPTIIRSGGVGVMSTTARFGAMLAPFVPLLGTFYAPLPLLLFGTLSLTAGILGLFLPETFRKKLPDTVEEAKLLGKKKKRNDKEITAAQLSKGDNHIKDI